MKKYCFIFISLFAVTAFTQELSTREKINLKLQTCETLVKKYQEQVDAGKAIEEGLDEFSNASTVSYSNAQKSLDQQIKKCSEIKELVDLYNELDRVHKENADIMKEVRDQRRDSKDILGDKEINDHSLEKPKVIVIE